MYPTKEMDVDPMVVIGVGASRRTISEDNVYFAFPSGRFGYDCVHCNAQCCRGHGYLVTERELRKHLDARPALALFMSACGVPGHLHVNNCAPGCFSLSADGRCAIQQAHGYENKPETCRLFPFNNIQRVGDCLVVAPHERLCPLAFVDPPELSRLSNHEAILEEMSLYGISHVPSQDGSFDELIGFERAIVTLAEQHLSLPYSSFVDAQVNAAAWPKAVIEDTVVGSISGAKFLESVRSLLGVVRASGLDLPGSNLLIAMTPALRSRVLLKSPSLPRVRIPLIVAGVHVLAELAKEAGMERITYQTMSTLFNNYGPLLQMCALLDCPVTVGSDRFVDLNVSGDRDYQLRYLKIVKALLSQRRAKAPKPLGTVVLENLDLAGMQRIATIKNLARDLAGRIVPVPTDLTQRVRPFRLAHSVPRWMVENLSVATLATVAKLAQNRQGVKR